MSFDLNILNYSVKELEEMFNLPPNYDKNIVEINSSQLRENILNNKEIKLDTKMKTLQFLVEAQNLILIKQPKENPNDIKTLIPKVYHTDYSLKPSEVESKNDHMVQVRENSVFISSKPGEYFTGVLNPLKRGSRQIVLNIDSKFRDNYYGTSSTNYNIFLPTNFNNAMSMILNTIELPTSYYIISKQYANNFFSISVNDNNVVIYIPDGNYNQNTIFQVIQEQLNASATIDDDFKNVVFTSNIDGILGETGSGQTIVGFNGNQSPNATLKLNFQADRYGIDDTSTPLPLKFGWLLGFRNGVYVNNINYVSEGILDLFGPRYFYLVVDDYNNNVNNNFYSAFNSSILNKNILARISLGVSSTTLQTTTFNILEQNNLMTITPERMYFGPVNIQTLTIQLLDEYGRIVNLNNMDFSFCLSLTLAYDV
jgi:hypothetical protein